MKSVIFWGLFLLIGITVLYVTYSKMDSFIDASTEMKSLKGLPEEPKFVVPEALPAPPPIGPDDVQPYAPPTFSLLSPPPGGVAVVNSLPFKDPSQENAPLSRIQNVLETAYGFLRNEATEIEKSSNPSLTLPLTTLRGDIQRLKDEVSVLSLNPGIESSLTQSELDDMEANLSYLQKKWRQQTENETSIEGFTDASGNVDPSKEKATLNDLRDANVKIQVEIARLSALSAADPLISNRISKLSLLATEIESIVTKVENGTMTVDMIPITKENYNGFLPLIRNPKSVLPATLKSADLSPTLASLLPAWLIGDISGSEMTEFVVNNYLETFFRGLSWDMRLNYTAERLKEVADAKEKTSENTLDGLKLALEETRLKQGLVQEDAPATEYRGEFAAATTMNSSQAASSSQAATTNTDMSKQPATFDWQERSKQICAAIEKFGYEPGNFGCLDGESSVGKSFSWRGYTRMICTRLGTLYDPSIPESCGCPPIEWSGWRA
jgi:hypothetical protein